LKNDIITDLIHPSIEPKIELIKYFIKRAKEKRSNEEFIDVIADYLSEKEKVPYLGHYCLIGPKHALGCLVGHFLYHYISEKDLKKQITLLNKLLNYIKDFQPSKVPLLKQTTTVKLINTIEQFGIPAYFLRTYTNRPLRIYYIPYKHLEFNAGYYPQLNSIVSYKPKEADSTPEYILMHEVGHLLTFNLTGDAGKVPDSFVEFNKVHAPKWKGDLVEVFVDLFSIAVMMDTEFAPKNPFPEKFPVRFQNSVKDYFTKLIGDLKYAQHVFSLI
jgi:hypothetical protein